MADIIIRTQVLRTIGGEQKLAESDTTFTPTTNEFDDQIFDLLAAAGDGDVTLWDSTVSRIDEPTFLAIFVDPEKKLATNLVSTVEIELTIDAVVTVHERNRTSPLFMNDPDGGAALGTIDGKLTLVRARNAQAGNAVEIRVMVAK